MNVRYFLCLFLMTVFQVSFATSTIKQIVSLDKTIEDADFSLRVRVLESRVLRFQYGDEWLDCGIVYRASIIDSINGNVAGDDIVFSSTFYMKANTDYLIFVRKKKQFIRSVSAEDKSRSEIFGSAELASCIDELPELNTDGSVAALEFVDIDGVSSSKMIYSAYNLTLPNYLKITRYHYSACESDPSNAKTDCQLEVSFPTIDWNELKGMYRN